MSGTRGKRKPPAGGSTVSLAEDRGESGPESTSVPPIPGPPPRLQVPFSLPQSGMLKIGEVARRIGVSVQAVRLYEAESVLISFRSSRGTRWFDERDIEWIGTIRALLQEGLNFEGIRRLLAQLPCWALRPCGPEHYANCAMRLEHRVPCWVAPDRLCSEKLKHCYHCATYRRAREFVNLKISAQIVPIQGD